MREIKFRQPIIVKGRFESWHYWGFTKNGFVSPEMGFSTIENARKRSQQYTNLKDKKRTKEYPEGQEMYEGDILTSLYKFDGCKGLYEVVWCVGGFRPRRYKIHQQTGVTITMSDLERCEILGNIHQHPHLLKEIKENA